MKEREPGLGLQIDSMEGSLSRENEVQTQPIPDNTYYCFIDADSFNHMNKIVEPSYIIVKTNKLVLVCIRVC
jgi:hypothetical protein